MKKLRLLVATSTWPLHDGDTRTPFVRGLADDMADLGWNVMVSAPHAAGAALRERTNVRIERFRYAPDRFETLAYGAGGLVNFRGTSQKILAAPFVLAQICALRSAIYRFRPDIVHAHWTLPQGFSSVISAVGSRVPVVTTVHGGDIFGLKSSIFRPFKSLALRHSTWVTVNSNFTAENAARLGAAADRMTVIPMAPSSDRSPTISRSEARHDLPDDAWVVAFVGRLIPEKGADDLIRAVAAAGDSRIHAVIIGDGPMRAELQRLAHDLGVDKRVRFDGWLTPDAIVDRLVGCDGFAGPSKTGQNGWVEAQGIVFLEAMRAGLAVFASRSGGIPSTVRDGETGWLFPESDYAALSRLLKAAADGVLPRELVVRQSGQQFARTVTRAGTAKAFDNLFCALIDRAEGL